MESKSIRMEQTRNEEWGTYSHTDTQFCFNWRDHAVFIYFTLLFLFAVLCVYVCGGGGLSLNQKLTVPAELTYQSVLRTNLTPPLQYWVYRHKGHAWFLVKDWDLNEILIWANSLSHWAMSPDLCAMPRNGFNNSNWVGDIHIFAYTHMYFKREN